MLILGCLSLWLAPQLLAFESDLRASVRSATARLRKQAGSAAASQHVNNSKPNSEKMVPVYVVLRGDPAVRTILEARTPSFRRSTARVKQRVSQIRAQQESVLTRLRFLGARQSFSYQRLANAIQVRVPSASLPEILSMPEVLRIDPVTLHELTHDSSVPYTGAPVVWGSAIIPQDGSGITIGVIDTGIDYTHANFGGSGLVPDFEGNDPDVIEPGTFPNTKVVGGHDFVGNAYNAASNDPGINTPIPDSDPLDCNGHGTHIAGSAAGGGVTLGGNGYEGPYTEDLDFAEFAIAPGVAPGAQLHALKVFGCQGASLLVMAALEYAADPNIDGDFSDRLDVVNLSVGVPFANGLDSSETELEILKNLAELGTSVVASAGNNGNTFYAVAAPGMAPTAISVAALDDRGVVLEGIRVTSPAEIMGFYQAKEGQLTKALSETGPISGSLSLADPYTSCSALNNAPAISGKIALLRRGDCDFRTKILNAQQAGALAVVVKNDADTPLIPMSGNSADITIPGVMISLTTGSLLESSVLPSSLSDFRGHTERASLVYGESI